MTLRSMVYHGIIVSTSISFIFATTATGQSGSRWTSPSGSSRSAHSTSNADNANDTAEFPAPGKPQLNYTQRVALAWQIALAANNFSPGILDGNFGPHSRRALKEYAARFFPGVNPLDPHNPAVFNALGVDVKNAITQYTITQDDADAVGHLHWTWLKMAAGSRMPYASLEDCLCEKFHSTEGLMRALNPHVNLQNLSVGQTINVPNIRPFPGPNDFGNPGGLRAVIQQDKQMFPEAHVAYLTVNLAQKAIRAYNRHNQQVALFWCSIAAHKADLPTEDAVIKDIALDPNYTFIPSMYPQAKIDHRLIIPPGPRNPVGIVWMGLDLPGVGMHGNPVPQHIGLTGSHGCFRMCNWDAVHLLTMVHIGLPVIMINPKKPIPLTVALPPGINPPGLPEQSEYVGPPASRRDQRAQ
ncbi:MAG: L,D-transpeptidase [Phycisphaerae bacterium]